jgi:hypothetical protein
MRRLFLGLLVIGSMALASESTDGVREAARGWRDGAIKQDAALLERYLADDLSYNHGNGKHQSKAEYIKAETQGAPSYESMTEKESEIRLYGDVAVLSGIVDVKPVKKDAYRVRTWEVYVKRNGHWQLAQKESVRVNP